MTSPFAIRVLQMRSTVSLCREIFPDAIAVRVLSGLAETFTIFARPSAVICVNRFMVPSLHQSTTPLLRRLLSHRLRSFSGQAYNCPENRAVLVYDRRHRERTGGAPHRSLPHATVSVCRIQEHCPD